MFVFSPGVENPQNSKIRINYLMVAAVWKYRANIIKRKTNIPIVTINKSFNFYLSILMGPSRIAYREI